MPLDANKIAHIQAVLPKTWAGRQKTVVLVSQSGGSYSYSTLLCIFRPLEVIDPEVPDTVGGAPKPLADAVLIAPLSTNFVGVVFVADTPTATAGAVAAAQKYEIIEVTPRGIVPGGTHYEVDLRRLR